MKRHRVRTIPARPGGAAATCPCGGTSPYPSCCGPLHAGLGSAATAEQLMRSRFCAFAVAEPGYLLRTWHSSTRPADIQLDPRQRWFRLEVLARQGGGMFEAAGTVEFRAHYRHPTGAGVLHERSRFTREDGQWRYLDAAG